MLDTAGLDEGTPLFAQIAERLAEEIADGGLAEGERVPSMNELAAFYRINPATAAKGLNLLADDGLLEKRRGIGMFVAAGARNQLLAQRRDQFPAADSEPGRLGEQRPHVALDEMIAALREQPLARAGRNEHADAAALFQ